MRPKTVITNWVHGDVIEALAPHCAVVANHDRDRSMSRGDIVARGADADAILAFMPDSFDEALLSELPRLRILACALKGYDNFDVEACTRRGVWVTIVPDLLTVPTAELTVGLMIALARNVLNGDRHMRTGAFRGWRPRFYGSGLAGSTVAIIGMGAVGLAVARRLGGFGARMLYADDRTLDSAIERDLGLQSASLHEALAVSDFVVLTLPLSARTKGLFDAGTIARMKPGGYLVNPGRGSLVDEEAVADALDSGHLAGYAADVFEMEDWARPDRPERVSQRLLDHVERTCLTPHIGSAVDGVRRDIAMAAAANIVQVLRGQRPENAINDVAPDCPPHPS